MSTPSKPNIGEPFHPWKEHCGFYPQDVVGKQTTKDGGLDLSDGQKRLYERLVRYTNRTTGRCFPGQDTLAEDLGKSERQIRHDIHRLQHAVKLIDSAPRPERKRSNEYFFLWHPIFENTGNGQPVSESDQGQDTGHGLPLSPPLEQSNTGNGQPISACVASSTPAMDCRRTPAMDGSNTGNGQPPKTLKTNLKTKEAAASSAPIGSVENQASSEEPKAAAAYPYRDFIWNALNLTYVRGVGIPPTEDEVNEVIEALGDAPTQDFRKR